MVVPSVKGRVGVAAYASGDARAIGGKGSSDSGLLLLLMRR
jgi:hypothetical protein